MTLRVFVADDSITIQKIVSLAFCGEDAVVEAVSDGDFALESLKRFRPDIVLADVFMPGCSGYELCARLKEDPELKKIPVILLVGTFEPFDQSEAARVKCDGHLTKPFDTEELIQTVHRLVGCTLPENAPAPNISAPEAVGRVGAAAFQSFLGDNPVLEIFDRAVISGRVPAALRPNSEGKSAVPQAIPEEMLDAIVDRVIRKMSPEIIREVAWEVVPELSESIIRSTLKDQ